MDSPNRLITYFIEQSLICLIIFTPGHVSDLSQSKICLVLFNLQRVNKPKTKTNQSIRQHLIILILRCLLKDLFIWFRYFLRQNNLREKALRKSRPKPNNEPLTNLHKNILRQFYRKIIIIVFWKLIIRDRSKWLFDHMFPETKATFKERKLIVESYHHWWQMAYWIPYIRVYVGFWAVLKKLAWYTFQQCGREAEGA